MRKNPFFLALLIILISFLAFASFKNSFHLALGGDDWGQHYLTWLVFDVRKEASYFNPFSYLCTYCPHYFFLPIISRFFGYEPFYYYLASYAARIIASVSLFFFIRFVTKRVLPAILASFFFAATYLGIEATDWAFNYNHILGTGVVAIFLIRYFKTKEEFGTENLFISAILFALAAIISPPRMHGLLPMLIVIEIAWFIIEGRKFSLRKASFRLITILITNYMILYGIGYLYLSFKNYFHIEIGPSFINNGYGSNGWNEKRTLAGLQLMLSWLSQGRIDFLLDPIATLGNFIVPDRLLNLFPYFWSIPSMYSIFSIFVLFCIGIKRKSSILYSVNIIMWSCLVYFIMKINSNTLSSTRAIFALVGGYTVILSFWLFYLLRKESPIFAHLILLSLAWMNTFTIFPWLIEPVGLIFSWGRYAVQQSAGVALWTGLIFSLCVDSLRRRQNNVILGFVYLLIALFIFMHIKFSNDYLEHVTSYRSRYLDYKYWNFITNQVPSIEVGGTTIFLLLTDQESAEIAEAIRFGFSTRAGLYYEVKKEENVPSMEVNNYERVLGNVYDGRYQAIYAHEPQPVPLKRVYAFILQNKEMYNITDKVRAKLQADLEALNRGTLTLPR